MKIDNLNSPGFSARTPKIKKFYVPGKNNTTLKCMTEGNITDLHGINCDILKHGNVIESKAFHSKKGFTDEKLVEIFTTMQTKVREGFDFMDELFRAHMK